MKKRVIWTNEVDIGDDAIADFREGNADLIAEWFDDEVPTDSQIIEEIYRYNELWFDDERANLNISTGNQVVCIGDLGLWNGRASGYRVIGTNINEIFGTTCGDYVTFYADAYNIHCDDAHHDGTNHYLYRELVGTEEDCDCFFSALYEGRASQSMIRRYTRSILPYVARVYGWPVAGRTRQISRG